MWHLLIVLAEKFTAQDAKEIGIANDVLKTEDLMAKAEATAAKLAAKPREALQSTKALMRREFENVATRIQEENEVFKERLQSEETQTTLANFFKPRKP